MLSAQIALIGTNIYITRLVAWSWGLRGFLLQMGFKPINKGVPDSLPMPEKYCSNKMKTSSLGCRMHLEPRIFMPVGIGVDEMTDNLKRAGVQILA
jgi:hypothetical protein